MNHYLTQIARLHKTKPHITAAEVLNKLLDRYYFIGRYFARKYTHLFFANKLSNTIKKALAAEVSEANIKRVVTDYLNQLQVINLNPCCEFALLLSAFYGTYPSYCQLLIAEIYYHVPPQYYIFSPAKEFKKLITQLEHKKEVQYLTSVCITLSQLIPNVDFTDDKTLGLVKQGIDSLLKKTAQHRFCFPGEVDKIAKFIKPARVVFQQLILLAPVEIQQHSIKELALYPSPVVMTELFNAELVNANVAMTLETLLKLFKIRDQCDIENLENHKIYREYLSELSLNPDRIQNKKNFFDNLIRRNREMALDSFRKILPLLTTDLKIYLFNSIYNDVLTGAHDEKHFELLIKMLPHMQDSLDSNILNQNTMLFGSNWSMQEIVLLHSIAQELDLANQLSLKPLAILLAKNVFKHGYNHINSISELFYKVVKNYSVEEKIELISHIEPNLQNKDASISFMAVKFIMNLSFDTPALPIETRNQILMTFFNQANPVRSYSVKVLKEIVLYYNETIGINLIDWMSSLLYHTDDHIRGCAIEFLARIAADITSELNQQQIGKLALLFNNDDANIRKSIAEFMSERVIHISHEEKLNLFYGLITAFYEMKFTISAKLFQMFSVFEPYTPHEKYYKFAILLFMHENDKFPVPATQLVTCHSENPNLFTTGRIENQDVLEALTHKSGLVRRIASKWFANKADINLKHTLVNNHLSTDFLQRRQAHHFLLEFPRTFSIEKKAEIINQILFLLMDERALNSSFNELFNSDKEFLFSLLTQITPMAHGLTKSQVNQLVKLAKRATSPLEISILNYLATQNRTLPDDASKWLLEKFTCLMKDANDDTKILGLMWFNKFSYNQDCISWTPLIDNLFALLEEDNDEINKNVVPAIYKIFNYLSFAETIYGLNKVEDALNCQNKKTVLATLKILDALAKEIPKFLHKLINKNVIQLLKYDDDIAIAAIKFISKNKSLINPSSRKELLHLTIALLDNKKLVLAKYENIKSLLLLSTDSFKPQDYEYVRHSFLVAYFKHRNQEPLVEHLLLERVAYYSRIVFTKIEVGMQLDAVPGLADIVVRLAV